MHVLVTGGSGFIGRKLVNRLLSKEIKVTVVGRSKQKLVNMFGSKITALSWENLYKASPDCIVHLAGHSISNPLWTKNNMQLAYDSRINTARLIEQMCEKNNITPKIIHTSGVTYYGFYDDCSTILNENIDAIEYKIPKFTQDLAIACEKCFGNIDKTTLRLAPVLDQKFGILPRLLLANKFGLNIKYGNGQQPFAWISIEDAINAIVYLIDTNISGPINLSSPGIINQKQFSQCISEIMPRSINVTMPKLFIDKFMGEFGKQFILTGQAAYPEKLIESNFNFKYPEIKHWLEDNY